MKQTILIIIMALTFTSCLKEVFDDCPGYMSFTFVYEGKDTGKDYDEKIGNDVHLRIYKDNVLFTTHIIPYEAIKGGKEYKIKKEVEGEIDIVAWAVPANEELVGRIPTPAEDKQKTGELLTMPPIVETYATEVRAYSSIGYLYLGTYTHHETDITENTTYPISMSDCIAEFTAAIHDIPEIYTPGQSERVWFLLHGIKSEMDIEFNPRGEDAAVLAEFNIMEETVLKTERHGILPSGNDQYLSLEIYKDESYRGLLQTDIQASPGDRIHLDIYKNYVTVYVNGWRVFNESVEWI